MVDLIELYRKHGLEVTARELPDHLPLFLEFLSILSPEAARPLLTDTAHILAAIRDRLDARKSRYAGVFDGLLFLAGTKVEPRPVADIGEDSFEALDRAWEDTPVTFGPESLASAPEAGGCQRAATILARINAN
jgi:nitrate reductase delta subunit